MPPPSSPSQRMTPDARDPIDRLQAAPKPIPSAAAISRARLGLRRNRNAGVDNGRTNAPGFPGAGSGGGSQPPRHGQSPPPIPAVSPPARLGSRSISSPTASRARRNS